MKWTDSLETKHLHFKNRLVMPPMATARADDQGRVTQELLDYYRAKTAGGYFAAVIVEHSFVHASGRASRRQLSVARNSDIKGLAQVAGTIQDQGSLAILQISHAGSLAQEEVIGRRPLAPSAVKSPTGRGQALPEALDLAGIESLVQAFVQAAVRAQQAGFDGVEVHSAHGYLLNQFLSPLANQRTDAYGGDIQGRTRIHRQIVRGIKKELGVAYPVFVRLGAGDFMAGGLAQADSVQAALILEAAGADVLDISGGMCFYTIDENRPGYFDSLSQPIFDQVEIPVILTGGVRRGPQVQEILDRQVCDLVGVGRALLQDPQWLERELGPDWQKRAQVGQPRT